MLRPARVDMRRRKPWVFARRRLLGWKVRLLTMVSVTVPPRGGTTYWVVHNDVRRSTAVVADPPRATRGTPHACR